MNLHKLIISAGLVAAMFAPVSAAQHGDMPEVRALMRDRATPVAVIADACAKRDTEKAITDCLSAAYTFAEDDLSSIYNRARLEIERRTTSREDAQDWSEALLYAQRAWLSLRDADCGLIDYEVGVEAPAYARRRLACLLGQARGRADTLLTRYDVETGNAAISAAFGSTLGAMIVRRDGDGAEWVHNGTRIETRFPPASTMKVLTAAIALEDGLITDINAKHDLLKSPTDPSNRPECNKDHSLASAFQASCYPQFQTLVRAMSSETVNTYLAEAYGSVRTDRAVGIVAENLGTFWMDGSVQITAAEQAHLMQRLYRRKLLEGKLSEATQNTLADLMEIDTGRNWTLRGKTGWRVDDAGGGIGWFVGWLELEDDAYVFAMNMDLPASGDPNQRIQIAERALEAIGAYPGRAL